MNAELTIDSKQLLSPVWTHLTDLKPVKGEGIYLYDEEGNRFTDFTSGIGVVNTGHCHPNIVKAVQEQAPQLLFGQMNCVIPPSTIKLAEKLNKITPPHIDRFFFANSGAEATEACVKLAKQATGRQHVIVFQGSFHGRTHMAMAMTTSKTVYRYKYQPLPGGIFVSPFPASYYYGWSEEEATDFCLKQLDLLFQGQTTPDETAAIIIEPILGEGGYIPAPAPFLQKLREICDEHGILLVMDEVQSGFGRTGKLFCFEHADIKPDIIVMAKGLGSGLPISGIASTQAIMDKWIAGTHGGTYGGGSAIASAAACATIDTIYAEGLIENAQERGEQLMQGLKELQEKYPVIGDIRGKGLMVATEFTDAEGNPDAETTSKVLQACLQDRLLLLACGSYKNVLRWIPPLVVSKSQIEESLEVFEDALIKVLGKK
ncbi:aspartate aminotransferase family protein [Sediminitomix flava]|uniref:4-aminobutyrate aminotransferase n=1 Tax=Sediminitomix flava TaxID=379075 RepID=A0A315ZYH8_SEDFL|nr:aminotransferase class III-fold pyridoxal phosphate-dependent enzyme [Sediminitomix flava]PWJ42417.1 4-aminobutyrate aminotransferase [Sediminitomix flava]